MESVDGFTIEKDEEYIVLTLTNIFGEGETFYFPPEDAKTIGELLIKYSGL